MCRNLLKLLPASHTVLLRSIIRLLRQVAASEHSSKMNVRSLAVCIAPSLLENPNIVDSAKRVPELAIYLIEKAADLFDNFAEDGLLPNSSAQKQADENSRRLHLSTDSGLSDDNFNNNNNYNYSSVHKRKHAESPAITSKVAGVNSLGVANLSSSADALPKSVSPDSALFENGLMSDCSNCSGDEDKNGTMKIEEIESSKHKPHGSLQRSKPSVQQFQPDQEEDEEDHNQPSSADRTPTALSRENSDVNTKFPNQWKSHIHTNGQVAKPSALNQTKKGNLIHKQQQSSSQEMNSPDLSARADVRVLRLKPNSASPAASPLLNSERFKRINSGNFVSNLDDLRVSDYIRVGGEMVKSNQQPLYKQLSKPSDSTNPTQKATIAPAPASNGLRRTALLSRNESLGIPTNTSTNSITTNTQSNVRTVNPILQSSNQTARQSQQPIKRPPFNSSTSTIKRANSVTASSPPIVNSNKFSAPGYKSVVASKSMNLPGGKAPALKTNPPRNKAATGATVQSTVNNKSTPPFVRGNSAGGNLGQEANHKTASPKPTGNSRRRLSEMRSVGGVGANSSLDRCASMQKPSGAWKPAKKTAEEIVFDKLEVNWSVTTIREVFQQNKDTKPAKIDTLFGVEHNFAKQRAVATATIAGKGKPFIA